MKRLFGLVLIIILMPCVVVAKIPNDPGAEQWAFADLGVYQAWDYFTGSTDVVVAIIDNGFDTFHPDLRNNLWQNKKEIRNNQIDDDENGYIDDVYGWNFLDNNNDPRPSVLGLADSEKKEALFNHGTLVAGIIGAVGNNKLGISGINWRVKLMNLKVVGNDGIGSMSALTEAIYYAVDNGADIINISMVGPDEDGKVVEAIKYAYEQGVVIIAAGGNNYFSLNDEPLYPVCADKDEKENWVLGVSAISESHHLAMFSNIGSDCIDITAPGVNITSTIRFSPTNGLTEMYSGNWSGTSFAAPMVSGAAALIKGIHPEWGPKEIYDILLQTVHHTPNQDEVIYANLFGSGLLQIDKAVNKAQSIKKKIFSVPALLESNTGHVKKLIAEKFAEKITKIFLKDIDQVTTCLIDDKKYFVTNKNKIFNFYDQDAALIGSWSVDIDFVPDFVCGDIDEDGQLDIILTAKEKNKILFTIYNRNGKKIKEEFLSSFHDGARLALENNEIRVVYKKDNKLILAKIDKNLSIKEQFNIGSMVSLGDFVVADLDNDGVSEYIIGAGKGDQGYVEYLRNNGKIMRKFWAYPNLLKSDIHLMPFDFNGDNNQDIISFVPNDKLIVWTKNNKKLLNLLPNENYNNLLLINK